MNRKNSSQFVAQRNCDKKKLIRNYNTWRLKFTVGWGTSDQNTEWFSIIQSFFHWNASFSILWEIQLHCLPLVFILSMRCGKFSIPSTLKGNYAQDLFNFTRERYDTARLLKFYSILKHCTKLFHESFHNKVLKWKTFLPLNFSWEEKLFSLILRKTFQSFSKEHDIFSQSQWWQTTTCWINSWIKRQVRI